MINNYKQFKIDNRRIDIYPTPKNKNKEKSNDSKKIKNNSFLNRNDFEENKSGGGECEFRGIF